ncbi:MAG: sigma 54-interacting transcriptional regulator [Pseudomonadota bacterium]
MSTARRPRVLVIDDGEEYAHLVATRLPEVELVRPGGDGGDRLPDGPAALAWLAAHPGGADLVLLDVHFDVPEDRLLPLSDDASPRRTRRFQGVAILRELRRRLPDLPVVLLTAQEDLALVDADGALAAESHTWFMDSHDLDSLRIRISEALAEAAVAAADGPVLWGRSGAMRRTRRRLAVLARGRTPVILEGETGTGKSFLAEAFVHARSQRDGPFVTLDLHAVPGDLVAAHLFGALRGAYTGAIADRKGAFEAADGGTLFMDEVQDLPMSVQKQLLVALQDRKIQPLGASRRVPVDVKIVAATSRSLADAVAAGTFRADLYMRLSPATRVVLPPLRERREDLPFLARRLAAEAQDDPEIAALRDQVVRAAGLEAGAPLALLLPGDGPPPAGTLSLPLPRAGWRLLETHHWPGNLRELSLVIRNLVTFTLVSAADAVRGGLRLSSTRLQVDPSLVGILLDAAPGRLGDQETPPPIRVRPGETLNAVARDLERQAYEALFLATAGDFEAMAERLLGDPTRARAVRLRFNQLGLKVRDLRRELP